MTLSGGFDGLRASSARTLPCIGPSAALASVGAAGASMVAGIPHAGDGGAGDGGAMDRSSSASVTGAWFARTFFFRG